ncbi:transcriptional regulator VanR, partial [Pseudomonas syringae pv. actinidiae ICMP 18804]
INGQGARAEALMREHSNATLRYADIFGAGVHERMKVIQRPD